MVEYENDRYLPQFRKKTRQNAEILQIIEFSSGFPKNNSECTLFYKYLF